MQTGLLSLSQLPSQKRCDITSTSQSQLRGCSISQRSARRPASSEAHRAARNAGPVPWTPKSWKHLAWKGSGRTICWVYQITYQHHLMFASKLRRVTTSNAFFKASNADSKWSISCLQLNGSKYFDISFTRWWFQHDWKILIKFDHFHLIISPVRDENLKKCKKLKPPPTSTSSWLNIAVNPAVLPVRSLAAAEAQERLSIGALVQAATFNPRI